MSHKIETASMLNNALVESTFRSAQSLSELQDATTGLLTVFIQGITTTLGMQRAIVTEVTKDSDTPETDLLDVDAMLAALGNQIRKRVDEGDYSVSVARVPTTDDTDELTPAEAEAVDKEAERCADEIGRKVVSGEMTAAEGLIEVQRRAAAFSEQTKAARNTPKH